MTEPVKPIVIAVDGSPPSMEALQTGINLARLMDRPIIVVHVVQLVKAGYFAFIDRHLLEDQEATAHKVLLDAQERCRQAGVPAETRLLESGQDPAQAIIEFLAEAGEVKFLVMGAHGHGLMARYLLGSVTERVLREITHKGLPVPILIVPPSMPAED